MSHYKVVLGFILLSIGFHCYADNENMTFFPIEDYSQKISHWFNPSQKNYSTNLLTQSYQQKRLRELEHTYFGTMPRDHSLWSPTYVTFILNKNKNLPHLIQTTLGNFDNQKQTEKNIVFGVNYRPYTHAWIKNIQDNINLSSFQHMYYLAQNRAIATENLPLRIIPTDDPAYYSSHIAGEGYPFDNIQTSVVYVGMPLYLLGTTRDKAWSLVMTPDCIGWMRSSGVARVSSTFVAQWQSAAYERLIGIKRTNISILDLKGNYRFSAYVGMIFPESHDSAETTEILIPVKSENGSASIRTGVVSSNDVALLPWSASREHFAEIFNVLKGRGYGWGGLEFNNDCSAEMKAIFTLFGIFMPRNTQSQGLAGYLVDISHLSSQERAKYLIKKGVPLLTLIHVKGHILLYVGAYKNKRGQAFPLSYQQVWSLYPKDKSSRSVIGQAVFLPLLSYYSQNPHLASQLDNEVFQLVYLNQWPVTPLIQTLSF